jgi:DNA-binding MarR family transcriptional regulator
LGQDAEIDDEVVSFVQAAIASICALELLILLRRNRQKSYSIEDLVRELRSSDLAVTQALERLIQAGFVAETPPGYIYRQESARLDAICERLESEYAHKPMRIIRAILEAPNEKLRVFADAFRLTGKQK